MTSLTDPLTSARPCVPAVNNTGSESVAFTQRTSLQVVPTALPERPGPQPNSPSDPLLASHGNVADSKC